MKALAVGAVLAAAVAAGAGGYLLYEQHMSPPVPVAEEMSSGTRLAAVLPAFELADRDGRMRSLSDWAGKSLIVNFWATWCAPCRREIPLLEALQAQYGAEGFQVVGIAADYRDKVLAFADEVKISYPLLIGEQDALDAATAFGVDAVGFPFTIFSDRDGRIIAAHMGELTRAEAGVILGAVRGVNEGRLSPLQARQEIEAALPALRHGDAGQG
jgi:thiol-disulfide isomerase/thioredoxin